MPFEPTNAPTYLVNLMSRMFQKQLNRFVVVFVDDILLYSKSKEEHNAHLEEVLDTLRKY